MTMVDVANPTVARRALTLRMHWLLEQHKPNPEKVAELLGGGASKRSRLSTGARPYQPGDVEKLADLFGLSDPERLELVALAEDARQDAWWRKTEIGESYRTLIGMEQSALVIHEYCANVLPGLLQTRAYAEAMVMAGVVGATREMAAQAADRRIRRQEILDREEPPEFWAVIDEVALARGAGGPTVMVDQFDHLIEMGRRPNINIQVIAFDYGIHTGPYAQVMLLEMPDPLPDFVYTEDKQTDPTVSSPLESAPRERQLFRSLQAIALDPAESLKRIETYREGLH